MSLESLPGRARGPRRSAPGLPGVVPLAAALAGCAQVSTGNSGASPGSPPAAPLPGGAYDRFVRGLADQDKFSGMVLPAYRGEPVLARSYQQADKDKKIPNQAGTIFNLGSVTKFFTSLAVTQLAAQARSTSTPRSAATSWPARSWPAHPARTTVTAFSGTSSPRPG